MSLLTAAANAAWCAASVPAYAAFRTALSDPRRVQLDLLRHYVQRNAATAFGREHRFDSIHDVDSFRRHVPVRRYDALAPWVDQIAAGQQAVLTAERVIRLLPSSGSTRAAKLVPHTAELQREFNRAIGPWIVDLYRRTPDLMGGSAYWSITPVLPQRTSGLHGALPIGFEEDSAYLGGMRKRLVDAVMAVPACVRHARDVPTFQFATLRHLLARRDLRLISVWHPSFLALLLDAAHERWGELLEAINRDDPTRGAELRLIGRGDWRAVWPNLRLVSCWADAHAAGLAAALHRRLPHVKLQPKGLLATEAFVSIPFAGRWPLAVRSHVLEFEDDRGRPLLADELQPGGEYDVFITTGGGLWRYRIGDRVRVDDDRSGSLGRTPSVRFVGRTDLVVDRFGEKLSEGLVGAILRQLLVAARIEADFAMLAPDSCGGRPCYTLFFSIAASHEAAAASVARLAGALDDGLRANPHYAYCRDLGQLDRPRLFLIGGGAYRTYLAAATESGRRLGDVKPQAIDGRGDWSRRFAGDYLTDQA
jgi:hypothetical protein